MDELKKIIDGLKEDLIKSTQELIQIDSVEDAPLLDMPFGEGVDKALRYVIDKAEALGFKGVYKDGYYGYIEMGEGKELVGILGHLDVVPAEKPKEWKYPPFGGEIHDNKIYGRGAIDDKGPVMSALYAMKAVKDLGTPLNKRIRLILGTNEETRWECINRYKQQEELPSFGFTPDAEYPLINAEKGLLQLKLSITKGASFSLQGGNALNSVPDYCIYKDSSGATKEFHGKAVHSAKCYEGDNAILKAVTRMYEEKVNCGMIEYLNKEIGNDPYVEKIFKGFEDKASGKLTFNVAKVDINEKQQDLYIDIRFPVSKNKEEILKLLTESCKPYNIQVSEEDSLPTLYVDENHFIVKTLQDVFQKETGLDAKPLFTGGATYARAFDNFVAYGPVLPGQIKTAHQMDEYIEVDLLLKNVAIYARAIEMLGK
ncbi:Sapep family Mn(2+)-dependent dipeptidase [Alkaliphilus serpentinus]|uniref:M20 family metallopeptidase n=1 Tax=Alkaliphilus serpentinus TaxID=1482731 RepID=A0A833M607_9FIRM|nr:Sapep family Mn(2+)-dependent dipeptidase [Alkaliphilus serpentinus]KAB3525836.1 M20 family metallopeptidase [Alkaliphilus serpentinus]